MVALIGSAVFLVTWLCCVSPIDTRKQQQSQSNWTSPDAPCAKFDDLRKPVGGELGVKIDAAQPWADGFRQALRFWNTVLTVNFHEVTDLSVCSVRIIDGGPDIVNGAVAARSQITDWINFRGKIAVNGGVAREMSNAEIYATAVHELGHMLGLKHNPSSHSVMFFLDVDGSDVLDGEDILELSRRHELRPGIFEKCFVPIQTGSTEIAFSAR